jgi:ABC-2 type transport system ATP-binding protein
MSVVVARGLGRSYGARPVLADVDLDVEAGQVVGLVGPNGGGKTTLLLLLAGLVRPTAGTVSVGGLPAEEVALRATGSIGLITAEAGLYPALTGRENLRFFAGLHGRGAEVDRRAEQIVADLGVDPALLDVRSATYSSGVRQKVSLVRALLFDPALLLLDEPTSHLDPLSARAVYGAVRARAEAGAAVVLATHDLVAAEHLCDLVLAVSGRIVERRALEGPRGLPPEGRLLEIYARASA